MVGERYVKPPIEEVVCEIHFADPKEWDITLPGRVYDKLRLNYPNKPQPLPGDAAAIGAAMAAHLPRALLSSKDGTRQFRLLEHAVSFHHIGPYPGWDAFSSRIREELTAFLKIAQPKTVAQIEVRFRNKILIPRQSVLLQDYFTIGTTIPHGIPTRLISYVTGFRAAYEDDPKNVLSLAFTTSPPERGARNSVVATLDIAASKIQMDDRADLRGIINVLQDLKMKTENVFERLITDHTRALFV
jgi:uncharacterized protein (TIGR04255 family)